MLHACYVRNMRGTITIKDYLVLFLIATFSTSTNTVRISQKKCEEYAKLVNNMEVAPTLRFGIQTHSVSQCKIIETPLIIGGVKAKNKEFPHMVAIGFGPETSDNFDDVDVSWECGGSVISEDFILTAAHCLESKYRGPAIRVLAGTTSLNHPDMDYQERDVAERIRHPNYTLPARYNDIGLIRLQEPLWLDGAVRPACLQILPSTMESGISSGFGKISFDDDDINEDLMKVQLNYISREECEKSYKYDLGGKMLPSGLIPSILCAGVMEGGKDTCQGDSGGPLQEILAEPYCMYSIVGITSFGKFCGFENSPGIYTRVSSYLDWIESIVWPDQD